MDAATTLETTPAPAPRMSRCAYFRTCGHEAPIDNPYLAFREDLSQPQDKCTVCRYTAIAHERFFGRLNDVVRAGHWPVGVDPHEFVAPTEGEPFDRHYCGCRGWD